MAAVFTLASAFSGGSSVAIDMIAGERERRSLQLGLVGAEVPGVEAAALAGVSIVAAAFAVKLFQRDAIVYGE